MQKTRVSCMWAQRVNKYNESGEILKTWCTLNHIQPARLRYWIRELKANDTPTNNLSDWISIDTEELKVVTKDEQLIVRIGSASIEVNSNFNKDLFLKVTEVLLSLC